MQQGGRLFKPKLKNMGAVAVQKLHMPIAEKGFDG
jgi:hypothetical protein